MALVVVFSNGRRRTYPNGVKVTVDSGALTLHQEKGVRMHHVSPSGWLEALETDKGGYGGGGAEADWPFA